MCCSWCVAAAGTLRGCDEVAASRNRREWGWPVEASTTDFLTPSRRLERSLVALVPVTCLTRASDLPWPTPAPGHGEPMDNSVPGELGGGSPREPEKRLGRRSSRGVRARRWAHAGAEERECGGGIHGTSTCSHAICCRQGACRWPGQGRNNFMDGHHRRSTMWP
jgi:hypothetical protein